MDVRTIASFGTAMEQVKTAQAVDVAVMKKAMDTQRSIAAGLLEALPPVSPPHLPPHLGQNINTKA
jgi:hypothetical protein